MPTPIVIEVGNLKLKAELDDSTPAQAVLKALPVETDFETWGDEYYFRIPGKIPAGDDSTLEVGVGDIAYWPEGKSLAIFYGPTPASPSNSDRPVAASIVYPVGRLLDDPTILRVVAAIGRITVREP